jgi:hypothetical protein
MGVLHVLKLSLAAPSRRAVFQLNRVKTKHFFGYILLLLLLIFLPNGIQLIADSVSSGRFAQEYLIILILYPSLVILFGILAVSLLASLGLLFRWLTGRKLVYPLLWRMTVYALTYPVLIFIILELFDITFPYMSLLLLILFIFIFFRMILVYPKARKKAAVDKTS